MKTYTSKFLYSEDVSGKYWYTSILSNTVYWQIPNKYLATALQIPDKYLTIGDREQQSL